MFGKLIKLKKQMLIDSTVMNTSCKRAVICGLVLLLTATTTSSIFAVEDQTKPNTVAVMAVVSNDDFEESDFIKRIGEVSYKKAISIEGEKVNLYPTFDNLLLAIDNIKQECEVVLKNMEKLYELNEFNAATAQQYYLELPEYENRLYEQFDNCSISKEEFQEEKTCLRKLYRFFDIYENEQDNQEILSSIGVTNTTMTKQKLSLQNLNKLKAVLPSNTGGVEKIEEIEIRELGQAISPMSYSGNSKFTVSDGVSYAVKYAKSPNSVNHKVFSGDCTNFTSQIKYAGGVPLYGKPANSGSWSYTSNISGSGLLINKYSVNWVRADAFVKFFGTKKTYDPKKYAKQRNVFIYFANDIKKGSFIAYDEEGDGNWNHNAFVTYLWHSGESARREISYRGSSYKDFKIAQHSRNYHKWVSENGDTGCGWEDLLYEINEEGKEVKTKAIFAIVN